MASFDGGYGSAYLAKWWGKSEPVRFSLGKSYSAQEAHDMGMVNAVVDHKDLEKWPSNGPGDQLKKSHSHENVEICI